MRTSTFPELVQVKTIEGTQDAIREAATREGKTPSEFVRAAIRAQLRRGDQIGAAPAAAGD